MRSEKLRSGLHHDRNRGCVQRLPATRGPPHRPTTLFEIPKTDPAAHDSGRGQTPQHSLEAQPGQHWRRACALSSLFLSKERTDNPEQHRLQPAAVFWGGKGRRSKQIAEAQSLEVGAGGDGTSRGWWGRSPRITAPAPLHERHRIKQPAERGWPARFVSTGGAEQRGDLVRYKGPRSQPQPGGADQHRSGRRWPGPITLA